MGERRTIMKQRNTAIPAAYLILRSGGGKILMALRANTGYQDGNWNLPSGHVEASESPKQAIIREAAEEIGVDIQPEDLELVHVSHRPKHDNTGDRIDFFFRAKDWRGKPYNAEPSKCAEVRWIHQDDLPEKITPHVRYAIGAAKRGEFYSELDEQWIRKQGVWELG
jgi:mutator protein MutT